MANLTHGTVTITLPDELTPPDKAGHLSPKEQQRIPRAPRDIGRACEDAADLVEKNGSALTLPPDLTADALRRAARQADGIDRVIADIEFLLATLKQANLLFDADAWERLRKLNALVKSQEKFDPSLSSKFAPLLDYFARRGAAATPARAPQPASEEPVT